MQRIEALLREAERLREQISDAHHLEARGVERRHTTRRRLADRRQSVSGDTGSPSSEADTEG